MQLSRPRRSGRVSESIAKRIKKQISDGALLPGEKLPAERDMALRYRTSRVSVREAYRSLEELGLLTIRRGAEGGAFITDLDHGPVMRSLSLMLRLGKTTHEEITEARLLIEPPIARLAARRAHPDDLDRLDYVVNQQELALERRGDYSPFDLSFHRVVAECARNLPLKVLMDSLSDLTVEVVAGLDLSSETVRAAFPPLNPPRAGASPNQVLAAARASIEAFHLAMFVGAALVAIGAAVSWFGLRERDARSSPAEADRTVAA